MAKLDPELLRLCPSKTVMYGCIDNGSSEVETPNMSPVVVSGSEVLTGGSASGGAGLWLGALSLDVARRKLKAMVDGAKLARERIG